MTAKPFLPFTRPSIDAESIAAVADVFRSGQLASGPRCRPSRRRSPRIWIGTSGARDDLGDRGSRNGARGGRRGRRR